MKRLLLLLLVLLLIPLGISAEENDESDWEPADWRQYWEEEGLFNYCDVRDDTLIIYEGVTVLSKYGSNPDNEDESPLLKQLEDAADAPALSFDRSWDPDFHRVSLPSTLRAIDDEAFIYYSFDTFTIPAQVELLSRWAFTYCHFDQLRVESNLPVETILDSLYDCTVKAWDVPDDHPTLKTIDGVLFSKDGKTLIDYPNARHDTHYDVPAGVERIMDIHNESLQTISLPIGLKAVDDHAFSGCTRLQAIALPLTVTEIGRDIFSSCVSLELVSLPEGLSADKDESGRWEKYYSDESHYRGDNGDTLAGALSTGRINAPGRLIRADAANSDDWTVQRKRPLIPVYDSADDATARGWYYQGKIVYMGWYDKGRVALFEPLGGTYTGTNGYGKLLGWVSLENVEYLNPQELFAYADVRLKSTMPVWWNHLPDYEYWTPWETVIPLEGRDYEPVLFGAFVRFADPVTHAVFGCAIQDVELTRVPDGTDHVYGIVYNLRFLEDIPLCPSPGEEPQLLLAGGTQVQILETGEQWSKVTDGRNTGWVEDQYLKIVEAQEEKEP